MKRTTRSSKKTIVSSSSSQSLSSSMDVEESSSDGSNETPAKPTKKLTLSKVIASSSSSEPSASASDKSSSGEEKPKKKTLKNPPKPKNVIVKAQRQSARTSNRPDYADSESSSDEIQADAEEDKGPKIDLIIGTKKNEKGEPIYLIKLREKSYRSAEWMTVAEAEAAYPLAKLRIKNFTQKDTPTDKLYNPEYSIPERILAYESDESEDEGESENEGESEEKDDEKVGRYFIKWKALPYEEATWESASWLTEEYPELIESYEAINKVPSSAAINTSLYHTSRSLKGFNSKMPAPEFNAEEYLKFVSSQVSHNRRLTLRDYQLEGFRWLAQCWCLKRNSILADEMGLGKTIQSLSILQWLKESHKMRGPFLIVVPMSCADQWQREIETWTKLNVVVYHGSQKSRTIIRDYEFAFSGSKKKNIYKFEVLLTTYEVLMKDVHVFTPIYWKYVVIDEAHRLKNPESKLYNAFKRLEMEHCLLLTGTPIQNNIKELWTMLHFVDEKSFSSMTQFCDTYGNLANSKSKKLAELQKTLSRYLLRRMKEDIPQSVPAKEETIIQVEITILQQTYYKALYERNRDVLFMNRGSSKGPSLMNILMQQRKVCNHPFLLEEVEDNVTKTMSQKEIDHVFVSCSSKLVLLDKILKRLWEEGHKVLIFSQMVMMLDLLERFCNLRSYPFSRLDGSISRLERQSAIDKFNMKPHTESFAFLLSTKAGGLGLNLTAANTVILYDSDWNPMNDLQAQARCHRIGQTKNVKVYRFVTKDTYEAEMFETASKKLGMNQAVLGNVSNKFSAPGSAPLSQSQVEELLKHGAYHIFKRDAADAAKKEKEMLEEDLESILSRSKTVVYNEPNSGNAALKFSTAVFDSETKDEIFEDSDFWKKVLPHVTSIADLTKSIQDGSLDSLQARNQFMEDLKTVVDRAIENIAGRSLYGRSKPVQEVVSLLNEVQISKTFSAEHKLDADMLHGKILGKRPRKVANFEPVDERPDDEDFKETKPVTRRVDYGPWTNKILSGLRKSLLNYGFGRWSKIYSLEPFSTTLTKKVNEEDVRCLSENLCFSLYAIDTDLKIKTSVSKSAILKSFVRTVCQDTTRDIFSHIEYNEPSLPKTQVIQENANNSWNIQFEQKIREPIVGSEIQVNLTQSDKTEDIYFFIVDYTDGARKHNFVRQYKLTPKQTQLSFKAPGFFGSYSAQIYRFTDAQFFPASQALHFSVTCHPVIFTEDFLAVGKNLRASWTQRFQFLETLNQLIEDYGTGLEELELAPSKKFLPVWWWSEKYDKAALTTIWKCGYGQFDDLKKVLQDSADFKTYLIDLKKHETMLAQKKAPLQPVDEKASPSPSEKDLFPLDAWPTTAQMNKRVCMVLETIENEQKKDTREKGDKTPEKKVKKGKTPEKKTKKEKSEKPLKNKTEKVKKDKTEKKKEKTPEKKEHKQPKGTKRKDTSELENKNPNKKQKIKA